MKLGLLNETANIYKYSEIGKNEIGETINIGDVVDFSVKIRVTRNKDFQNSEKETAYISSSTHLIFIELNATVENGYYILRSNGERFFIKYVDKTPAGVSDSHYVAYCILSEATT